MYKLSIDYSKCEDSGECTSLCPEFRNVHGATKFISQDAPEDKNWRLMATQLQKSCPNRAILFKLVR